MNKFEYEIDNKNVVKIWVDKETAELPLVSQPFYPDGTKWSKEQAIEWAEIYCNAANDPAYPYLPGFGPAEPARPRPFEEAPEIEEAPAPEEPAVVEETPAE